MLVFRSDGNQNIGSGHIMRCISIADAAVRRGQECLFLTAGDEFGSTIASHGHKNIVLNTEYNHMEQGLSRLFSILTEVEHRDSLEAVVVDSYQVTWQYLNQLREFCREKGARLVYLDDVLSFAYPCDLLVNYNIYGPDCDYASLYRGTKLPVMLLGTRYAPLRAEFQNLPARVVREDGKVILVSTGGADFEHLTIHILREIFSRIEALRGYEFHFIVGAMNEDVGEIQSLAKQHVKESGAHVVLHSNVANMQELMGEADVAISAAGSTLYELCATNTPTITYILADNQIPGAEGFSRHGVLKNIGDVRVLGARKLSELLIDSAVGLCKDYRSRKSIAFRMSSVVDGNGAERIAEAISCKNDTEVNRFV